MITHKSIGYSGRLGNQMFQYAALKALSLNKGFECFLPDHLKIKKDGAFDFTNNSWLEYKLELLDCFNISCPVIENKLNTNFYEKDFAYDPLIDLVSDNTGIEGYFQSYKYFESFEDQIRNEFIFKPEIMEKCKNNLLKFVNPISLHIRRGDYVNHPNFWTVTAEYLAEALEALPKGNYSYLVFSDDIDWCKQIFNEDFYFMEGNSKFEDLCLMSLCKHNIISNSSYSWWAAWLNSNISKTVIAPKNWFTDPKPLCDLYPKTWTII